MTFEEMLNRAERKGEERLTKLILLLNEQGRIDDMVKAAADEVFRQGLYVEFGLDEEKTE